jgi:hypothetical protein
MTLKEATDVIHDYYLDGTRAYALANSPTAPSLLSAAQHFAVLQYWSNRGRAHVSEGQNIRQLERAFS